MKILCIADHPDPVVYSDNIRARFGEVDLVISCGDLPFSYYDFITSNLNQPVLFVFGNHNLRMLKFYERSLAAPSVAIHLREPEEKIPSGGRCIDGTMKKVKGLLLAGLGGSMDYNHGRHQFTDAQMTVRALKLIPRLLFNRIFHGRWLDILVTHTPPLGIHDQQDLCHRGFRPFLWFCRRFKPRYLIHGHIHLYEQNANRTTQYHDTIVINAYNHTVIEIDAPSRPVRARSQTPHQSGVDGDR